MLVLAFLLGTPRARADIAKVDPLLQQARDFESKGQWDKACDAYEAALRIDRSLTYVKEKHQQCLRRYWQARRHRDVSYRKEVLSLNYGEALRLYGIMRDTLLDNALEKTKADAGMLLQKGIEELDAALSDPYFAEQYAITSRPEQIRKFRDYLRKNLRAAGSLNREQAAKKVRDIAFAAETMLNLSCTVTLMELTCGACYALDEYTLYLTPNQLRELCDSVRGGLATPGIELRATGDKLMVHNTAPGSEAAANLNPGDEIIAINRKPARSMSIEDANEQLAGQPGTTVEIQVLTRDMGLTTLYYRRDTSFMPSVIAYMMPDTDGIGYLQINCFKHSTVDEVDKALATSLAGMKTLVLDLRDNNGGLFDSAVEVARRFIADGVIAITENADPDDNRIFEAKNPGALALPLVVLVNGDTASAAEVLAGALKENKRARLVGQTTFGKGCTQCFLKFPNAPGGIPTGGLRLTVSRVFSPDRLPYTGRGVTPHLIVDRLGMGGSMMGGGPDQQLEAAILETQRLVEMMR